MEGNVTRNPMPAVSVLMPVYDAARFLAEAIESILHQTFQDFEFLIIDDGSTDRSLDILRLSAAQDDRICLVARENRGLVVTLNEGLDMARAPLVARMDADDISLPTRLEKQVAFMREHADVAALGCNYEVIDEKGRVVGESLIRVRGNVQVQDRLLAGDNVLHHPTVMFRRDAVRRAGGYDAHYRHAEDIELWLRLGETDKLDVLAETLVQYRDHVGAVSSRHHDQQLQMLRRVCGEACARRGVQREFLSTGWRPRNSRELCGQLNRRAAFGMARGDRRMAIEYAFRAVCARVISISAWKLLSYSLLQPPRWRHRKL